VQAQYKEKQSGYSHNPQDFSPNKGLFQKAANNFPFWHNFGFWVKQ
jgi:hypothetical protein